MIKTFYFIILIHRHLDIERNYQQYYPFFSTTYFIGANFSFPTDYRRKLFLGTNLVHKEIFHLKTKDSYKATHFTFLKKPLHQKGQHPKVK